MKKEIRQFVEKLVQHRVPSKNEMLESIEKVIRGKESNQEQVGRFVPIVLDRKVFRFDTVHGTAQEISEDGMGGDDQIETFSANIELEEFRNILGKEEATKKSLQELEEDLKNEEEANGGSKK